MDNSSNRGELQLILGPMYSGKSTELIRRIKRFQLAKHKCLIINYANDDRYARDSIATHDRQTLSAISTNQLIFSDDQLNGYTVIGIDEGQFFDGISKFADDNANKGRIVIVAALDGDFRRRQFSNFLDIIPLSETITKLTAICTICYKMAPFTRRLTTESTIELIGGAEKYAACCRDCYINWDKNLSKANSGIVYLEETKNLPFLQSNQAGTSD